MSFAVHDVTPKPIILLAEDSESDIALVELGFEEAQLPFSLQFVPDGIEAIEYLSGGGKYGDREAHPLPRMLLTDLKMPRMGGFELLAWVRSQDAFRHLPVIVISGSDQPEDQNRAVALGANEFVVKDLLIQPDSALFGAIRRQANAADGVPRKRFRRAPKTAS
jgi:CheY-like chemotaxis protein